ncbi:MAG: hypothetical protein Q8S00_13070 [Deltaproteobacteria bacterium]|nr:hypothetical protein [Deltaproteobacteria bacterium]MDZ4343460.1 hypothetical protein [Candidatus Binatia bacterium]
MKALAVKILMMAMTLGVPLPVSSYGWDEPTGFGPLKFNDGVQKQFEECPTTGLKTCWEYHRIGLNDGRDWYEQLRSGMYTIKYLKIGDSFLPNITVSQTEDKIEMLNVTLPNSVFGRWVSILTERYGKPTSIEKSTWMSKGGVRVDNSTVKWIGNEIHITITEHGSKIDETDLSYSTKAWRNKLADKRKEHFNKAVKDL